MIRDRLLNLFKQHDQEVQRVIAEVLKLEQENISMERPRGIKEDIKEIIDRVVKIESKEELGK